MEPPSKVVDRKTAGFWTYKFDVGVAVGKSVDGWMDGVYKGIDEGSPLGFIEGASFALGKLDGFLLSIKDGVEAVIWTDGTIDGKLVCSGERIVVGEPVTPTEGAYEFTLDGKRDKAIVGSAFGTLDTPLGIAEIIIDGSDEEKSDVGTNESPALEFTDGTNVGAGVGGKVPRE